MQIKFRINFDEPLRLDEAWPLSLPNDGTFCAIHNGQLATAFEVSFPVEGSKFAESNSELSQNTLQQWAEMRRYFARLKGYIQCVAEINYVPVEVELMYEAETDEEKASVSVDKVILTRGAIRKRKGIITYETLCGAAIGSLGEKQSNHHFIGELKNLSRRAEREGRYVDSFRYGFLLLDALYGKGQFKTTNLKTALKSEQALMDMVRDVRLQMREKIERIDDPTERILCGAFSDSEVIDHLVMMRGRYFHGKKGALMDLDWANEEGRNLCRFVNELTDIICREELRNVLSEESWDIYEKGARKSGKLVEIKLEAKIWDKNQGERILSHDICEKVGSTGNELNRIHWACQALMSLTVDDNTQEVESIVGRERHSGLFIFSIDLATSVTMDLKGWKPTVREGSEFVPMADVKYFFEEDEEEREAELRIQPSGDVVVFDNRMVRGLAIGAILNLGNPVFDGIYLVDGVERDSRMQLFRIRLKEDMAPTE